MGGGGHSDRHADLPATGGQGAVRLTVGHHRMEGAMAVLPKPLVLLRKARALLPGVEHREAAAQAERGARGEGGGVEGKDGEGKDGEGGGLDARSGGDGIGVGAARHSGSGMAVEGEASVRYRVEGVIRHKLIFKTRPKLVLSNAQ
ncbi:hypothetical protein CLOP_g9890 [Closterium sp. NIES-67]|nr:hypothetical protein CLOP_g9890 [Closterium sp. NIES-67]